MNLDVCINIYITPAYSQMAGEEESDDGTSTASGCRLQSGLTRFNCRTAQALTKEMAAIMPVRAIGPRCPHFVQPFTFSDTYLWLFFLSPSSQYPFPPAPPPSISSPSPTFNGCRSLPTVLFKSNLCLNFMLGQAVVIVGRQMMTICTSRLILAGWFGVGGGVGGGGNGNLILVYVCSVADTYL